MAKIKLTKSQSMRHNLKIRPSKCGIPCCPASCAGQHGVHDLVPPERWRASLSHAPAIAIDERLGIHMPDVVEAQAPVLGQAFGRADAPQVVRGGHHQAAVKPALGKM